VWVLLSAFSGSLLGQTNEEVFREYQFDFSPPGARANAMGGAFIGVADDATSSFSNPAGLAFLTDLALTVEYRHRRLDNRTGEVAGRFNTQFEQLAQELEGSFASLNFSYGDTYFGIFQYDYLDERQERRFQFRTLNDGIESVELRDVFLDLTGTTLGVGAARRLGAYKVGLTVNRLSFRGLSQYDRLGFSRPPYRDLSYTSDIDDRDHAWGFSLGVHHELGTKFSWGAVWRENPSFRLMESVVERADNQIVLVDEIAVPFVVPDVFGVGLRYRPRPTLSLLLDWQQIFYSQIIEDGFVIVENISSDEKANYDIDDTNELRMGFEWLIPRHGAVFALRGGYYRNPLHAVTYSGPDQAIRDRFAGTGLEDEDHVTFGFGWVYRNRIELDVSVNLWEVGHEVTTSLIWRKK